MFSEVSKYKQQGHFFLRPEEDIASHIKLVPNAPGVFYAIRLAKGHVDLVYIGKSGTTLMNGSMQQHDLRFMIQCNSDGCMLYEYKKRAVKESIEALDIYWFVTYDKSNQDLPSYVSAVLTQRYFEVHGKLPPWNQSF